MSTDVLAIGSWDRSGSTILAEVLGTATGVVSVGEVNNLWDRGFRRDRPCACGLAFSTCPFWSEVMATAFGDAEGQRLLVRVVAAADELTNQRLILRRITGSLDRRQADYSEGLGRLYRGVAEVSGARVIVDSSKIPWHLAAIEGLAGITAWVIHLIRDPRGVVNSHQRLLRYDTDDADPEMMAQQGAMFATLGWGYRNLLISALWGGNEHYMRIRYEDFVSAPERVTAGILRSVGAAVPLFEGSHRIDLPAGHSVAGNPVRFTEGTATIRPDDGWRRDLATSTRVAVGLATWPLRRLYRRSTPLPLAGLHMEIR